MRRELIELDGLAAHRTLLAGECSARELVDAYLAAVEARDAQLGCYLAFDADGARTAADALDARRSAAEALPDLAGFVVAVKDNLLIRGLPATAASRILEGYRPPYEATVVERLRAAGAIVLGKTNLDEFAMGASTEGSGFHPTRNPHDPTRVPGGSSGGSAAAVAAHLATAALGSDTGGSIRQPAAFCGVVGLRPTYGAVSRSGLVAMASSMDVVGPLSRTVADARRLMAAMAGYDQRDATSLPHFAIHRDGHPIDPAQLRIGLPAEYLEGMDAAVRQGFDRAVEALRRAGAKLRPVHLPMSRSAIAAYYVITPAEASSNLARYDGIRFGHPASISGGHATASAELRGARFGVEPKRRLLLGAFTLSAGYVDRYYHLAQRVRTLIRQDFANAFNDLDVLLTPTTPTPAFPLGAIQDPLEMYRQDVFLTAASLAGVPALHLPVPSTGLPVGVQLIGPQASDDRLLDIAAGLERRLVG